MITNSSCPSVCKNVFRVIHLVGMWTEAEMFSSLLVMPTILWVKICSLSCKVVSEAFLKWDVLFLGWGTGCVSEVSIVGVVCRTLAPQFTL